MPGLIRGMARTAVIAGTATSVSNRVSRRQYNRWSQQDEQQQAAQVPAPSEPAPPAAAPASAGDDRIAKLQQLGDLHNQGILTDEEFAAEKAKILNS
ncbi:MAG TPA: SHOCT domain-containing protein [Solirubrobacteraceae bacterium]|nr:SHOCT domain-containing protein [Solirubrobacteraceae bacterium]